MSLASAEIELPMKRKMATVEISEEMGDIVPSILKVKRLSEAAKLPSRESIGAAGYDLYRYCD